MFWIFKPGFIIPFIGWRRLPVNRDGSLFDTGEFDLLDEKAPFYAEILAVEWLGIGVPLWPWAQIRDARTGQPVE